MPLLSRMCARNVHRDGDDEGRCRRATELGNSGGNTQTHAEQAAASEKSGNLSAKTAVVSRVTSARVCISFLFSNTAARVVQV